jgi:cellobiose phosphorylase
VDHYIGTPEFGGLVDHTGGALICAHDPGITASQIHRAAPDSDFKRNTVPARAYHQWSAYFSPFFVPTLIRWIILNAAWNGLFTLDRRIRRGVLRNYRFRPGGCALEIRDISVTT